MCCDDAADDEETQQKPPPSRENVSNFQINTRRDTLPWGRGVEVVAVFRYIY